MPLDRQPAFVAEAERRIKDAFPAVRILMVGHIGDGNIHVIALFDRAHFADQPAFGTAGAYVNC